MPAATILSLEGAVALVTGASGGLGRHFAGTLAEAGATVAVAARRRDKVQETVTAIEAAGGRAFSVDLDVTQADSVAEAFGRVEGELGTVSIVVNNAGIASRGAPQDIEEVEWDRSMDTNLKGVWLVATEAAKRMIAAGTGGSIINIASIMGLRITAGLSPYAISKAGVVQMTKSCALEWVRHGIRVNALAPGYFETDINREFLKTDAGQAIIKRIPMRRTGDMKELDGPLLLLASEAGAFMTGTVIPVDGGHLVSGL